MVKTRLSAFGCSRVGRTAGVWNRAEGHDRPLATPEPTILTHATRRLDDDITDMPPISAQRNSKMEKESLLPQTEEPMPRRPTPKPFSRFHGIAFAFVLGLFWLSRSWSCGHDHMHEQETASKVPLEIHIMYAPKLPSCNVD